MAIVPQSKLDLWVETGKNVMFVGRHGVGKTAIVEEAWGRAGLNYLYFSAANMDPWIDLIGVPRERSMQVDGKTVDYIECVPPKALALDEVDAIFFDEYNRAPEKVRNATMQFIQRKEINGRKFNRLKMIWIAINPPDTGEYDVQELDPAQSDRFQVHYHIPFRPDEEYFTSKYGELGSKFTSWWWRLPDETKNQVSPRRLDYAAQMFLDNGDIEDVLPRGVNISELISVISRGSIEERLDRLMHNPRTKPEDIEKFIQDDNNFQHVKEMLSEEDDKIFNYFAPYLEDERVLSITTDNYLLLDRFVFNGGNNPDKVELLKKHSPKAHIIPELFRGLVAHQFDYKNNILEIRTEEGQPALMEHICDQLQKKGSSANAIYAAAHVYEYAKETWPHMVSKPYAKRLLSHIVEGGLSKYNLEGYFKL